MPLAEVAAHARRAEALGYDGLCVPEAVHDGLLSAQAALAATTRLRVMTAVLVAFPRSPMTVAHAAWDLQGASGGRFELGLGPQVRGNIVHRYSTPWSAPAPRMREYVGSLRAIFAAWQDGTPLGFEGEHYTFTRMQPFFDPGPLEHGPPPIWLGAVGPRMTALAGEVADGLLSHPTHSAPAALRELARPRLAEGAARAGRSTSDCRLVASPLIATGRDASEVAEQREHARQLLGFLYSTPAYWPALEQMGRRELGEKLHALVRAGDWGALPRAVDDALLDAVVPAAPHAEIADRLCELYAGLATGLTLSMPPDPARDPELAPVLARVRSTT